MTFDWNSIIPAFAAGAFASLILPLVNWRVEAIRLRHQSRKEKIQEWQTQLEKAQSFADIRGTLLWQELRPYLTEAEQKEMRANVIADGYLSGEEMKITKLLQVVVRVQKEWKII